MSITQTVCVFIALGSQHAMRMCHIVICAVSRAAIFFALYLINDMIVGKNVIEHKMYVLFFSTTLSETFIILERNERDMIKMYVKFDF